MFCLNISNRTIITVKGVDYRCTIHAIIKSEAVHFLENFVLDNLGRSLTRPYRGSLTVPSQLKVAEYFPNWVFPKLLNPIKLRNKYYWFFVCKRGYKLQFDYGHLLITTPH